ncbi:hypothetical protein B7C51_20320 [Paenibacillus larvae subsp. pulvifaciens]|uniref:Uncharacterized protein n=1 Tax=Paenibacillus larvae subsp. pulvifaciens TaxID=1477 RepID=A0A1V0UPN3_9BACL|nr:hypothetical protein [Paenibacillus larvae]ARF66694.1 hypothetical protein B7C51_01045 [Paenibacillus larvae subsp. pulvifaciens]ARF67056.1 hypothetical protein B7C51_03370 [Paenibacillus larvae subsp. pulvifaciens]ARF69505.1 hypothetical protein B7C51_19305 [Paenibacillus larvae subsp. pulvifaciens]ARF69674.1 hypothetical protein B7C51_20320 [Paenibacillus larvae subsp. pulvifaciens]
MKSFESIYKAVRYIKSELSNVEVWEELYLMVNTNYKEIYVSDCDDFLEDIISGDWDLWEMGKEPSDHLKNYHIWVYVDKSNNFRFPILYKDFKPTLLSKKHIRNKVTPEVNVSFNISNGRRG